MTLLSAIFAVVTLLSASLIVVIPESLTDNISLIIVNDVSSTLTSNVLLLAPDFIRPLPATRSANVNSLFQLPVLSALTSKLPELNTLKPVLLPEPNNKCELVVLASFKLLVETLFNNSKVLALTLFDNVV